MATLNADCSVSIFVATHRLEPHSFQDLNMLKQSPGRNLRSKGFKVKHFIQVFLLLAIGVWLVNQFKHSYDKKAAYEDSTGKISEEVRGDNEVVKLGRKGLHPWVRETGLEIESHGDKAELEEETDEIKPGEIEDEGSGGDDEIDGHGQVRTDEEETEETIRKGKETNEDQEIEEKGDQLEDVSSLDDQSQNEGERNLQDLREEHYRGDDASKSMLRNSQSIITQLGIGGLRKIKESEIDNAEHVKLEHRCKNHGDEAGPYGNAPEDDEKSTGDLNLDDKDVDSDSSSSIDDHIDAGGSGKATASLSIILERVVKLDANVVGKLGA
ncbi:PROTEIN putative-RELATED [Salix viminalis]|uniref:PROTEIN putative-RELATED n=1 Tax=Salix viminalis TaxID=40686 RepID=A0A9Q0UHJ0_SALVM|nr:PROTEIN putative-RELATED [Salix viminalis]